MKMGIVVSDVTSLKHNDGSLMIALAAARRQHDVSLMSVGDFEFEEWKDLRFLARSTAPGPYSSTAAFYAEVTGSWADRQWVEAASLDVLLLRSDAYEPDPPTHWSHMAAVRLGKLAAGLGVLVLSDPDGLFKALDKTYIQRIPARFRPQGVVTRSADVIASFVRDHRSAVIKPIEGGCGRKVFYLDAADPRNMNQLIDMSISAGYVVVQEYVAESARGTLRFFFLDGEPIEVDGHYAALMHVPGKGDVRSNVGMGGSVERAVVDEATLCLARQLGPIFATDGLFLVGADLAGGKLLDISATTPGGMWGAERFEGVSFAEEVVCAIERKVGSSGR